MFIKTEPSSDDHSLQSGTSTPTTCEQATASTTEQPPNESTKKEVDTTVTTTTSFTTTSDQVPMSMPLQDDLCLTAMEATIQSVFDALNVLSQQQQQQQQQQHTPQQNQSQADQQKTQSQPQQGQPSTAPSLEAGLQSSNSPTSGRNGHTVPYPVVTPQPVAIVPELSPAEQLKQQMMKQKIRDENRTRKQRWRVNNEERNKDNDLRCRVNKRSHKLFGMEPSEHKKKWVAEEFQRRRIKRQEKERRKQAVNGALAATNSPATPMTDESESATIAQLQHKLLQHYQSLFGMDQQDSEKTKNSTAALVAALQNPQLLQLSQLLAQTVTATTGPVPSPHSSIAPSTQATTATTSVSNNSTNDPSTFVTLPHNSPLTPREDNENNSKGDNRMELDQSKIDLAAAEIMKQFTSHALAGTAHHLDQSALGSSSTTIPTATSEPSEISTIAATSTSGTTTPTTSVSPTAPATGSSINTITVAATPVESSKTANTEDTIMEDAEKDDTKKEQGTEKKNDYPMDAVMTLMELNAGWRP